MTGDSNGAIWLSTDGVGWQRQPLDSASALMGIGKQRINSLLTRGRQLVAVGSETSARDDNGAVWIARVSQPSS